MWLLALTFGMALATNWGLTRVAAHVGRRFDILDHPDQDRKFHPRATPRTGGLALCLTVVAGFALLAWQRPGWGIASWQPPSYVLWLALTTALLCGLGLWDDKYGMQARTKFGWQILAILPFACSGGTTTGIDLLGWHLGSAQITIPLILFWLVSCTNFVNLIDGLDGLAGTVGLIAAVAVAVMATLDGLTEITLLATVLAGALLGFLAHNWPPARVFLGDSGSLPLGFLVGALSLEASAKKAAGLTLVVPLVLLGVPIFDTSMAILRRKLNGRNIGQGDRAHIHHCLRDRGLSSTQTLLAIGGLCVATAAGAVLSTALDNSWIAIGTGGTLVAFLVASRVFGFYETMLLVRHAREIVAFLRRVPRVLRVRFEIVRLADSATAGQPDLWERIVSLARTLPGGEVEFLCEHIPSGRELCALTCLNDVPIDSDSPVWHVSYVVPRGDGILARGEARGGRPADADSLPYQELAELLAVLCRDWPIETPELRYPPPEAEEMSSEEPAILSPIWPGASSRNGGAVAFGAFEREAA
jgi:UDP-GlcNAc:undecaprenyl-phosphate GlcNAc-1-phosphate transferase